MKIAIDKNVPVPAYQQVVDGISGAIARGDVPRGSRLPSVRNLAVDLGLNVNTIARAYRDLERAGVIDTRPGMGTFVATDAQSDRPRFRPIPATGGPAFGLLTPAAPATWRELLAAARTLAAAEGVPDAEFLGQAAEVVRASAEAATYLVVGFSPGEAADLLRALPTEVAAACVAVDPEALAGRLGLGGVSAILTSFPALSRVRARLGPEFESLPIVPLETQLSEQTVRDLSGLVPTGRLALVTLEKSTWDHEANDVMRVVGRSRWLKMVLLEHGEKGLDERLEQVDAVLYVPRAAESILSQERRDRQFVELRRELTTRARERLLAAVGHLR